MSLRSVSEIVPSVRTLEGGGFPVRRPFPTGSLPLVDPFLLLDEMGPVDWAAGEAIGAPDHPHRGFETVTYLLAGEAEHKDSHGHVGRMGPGDVQWMTAGAGVVHSEMPTRDFRESGGRMHGFQLWVNLPAQKKMMAPRYQDIRAEESPLVTSADGTAKVRVIAGEALGARAALTTEIPIVYLHVSLQPWGTLSQPIAPELTALGYLFSGSARFGEGSRAARDGSEGDLALFASDGDTVLLTAGHLGAEILLLAGQPLREPVARYGPFVMNTPDEIRQAFADYQSGAFGRIRASTSGG